MPPDVPTCPYCERPYSSSEGCDYLDGDEKPMPYGSECHPLSFDETCRDCGTPRGREHHAYCLACECPDGCHRQFHAGLTCDEDAPLTTGAGGMTPSAIRSEPAESAGHRPS